MSPRYTEFELAKAIEELIDIARPHMTHQEFETLMQKHPCVEEINQFSAKGPCGSGLGRFGGHAV